MAWIGYVLLLSLVVMVNTQTDAGRPDRSPLTGTPGVLLRDILYGVTEDDNEAPNNHNRKSRRDGNHAPLPGIQATDVHELLSALQAHTERGREEAAEIRPGPRRRAGGPGDAAAVPGSPGPSSREDGGTSRNSARSKGVMYPVPREERPGPGAAAATFPAGERGYPGNQPQEEVVSPGMEFILGLYERLQAGQTLEEASGHRGATVLSSADTVRTFAAAVPSGEQLQQDGGRLVVRFHVTSLSAGEVPKLAELRLKPKRGSDEPPRPRGFHKLRVVMSDTEGRTLLRTSYRTPYQYDEQTGDNIYNITPLVQDALELERGNVTVHVTLNLRRRGQGQSRDKRSLEKVNRNQDQQALLVLFSRDETFLKQFAELREKQLIIMEKKHQTENFLEGLSVWDRRFSRKKREINLEKEREMTERQEGKELGTTDRLDADGKDRETTDASRTFTVWRENTLDARNNDWKTTDSLDTNRKELGTTNATDAGENGRETNASDAIRKERVKRATGNRKLCERRDLHIDFEEMGWGQWIVYPKRFNAYMCVGKCPTPIPQQYAPTNHAVMQSLARLARRAYPTPEQQAPPRPCCVPSKLYPISMLYYEYGEIVVRHHKGMVVDDCACR